MEVVVAEEKKKIFRARKTMKISDRQQLESLHNTLLTGGPPLSNPSPPPLLNGTHKEDGQKVADKEQNDILDSNSPHTASPVSPASRGSPAPSLSLNLSPSPPSSQSPKAKEETPTSPTSPFHSLNFELKKMEEEGKKGSSPSSSNECPASASAEAKEGQKKDIEVITEMDKMEKKAEAHATTEGQAMDSVKDSVKGPPVSSAVSGKKSEKDHRAKPECTETMEMDSDTTEAKATEASTAKRKMEKPYSPKGTTSAASPQSTSPPCSSSSHPAPTVPKQDQELKDKDLKEEVKDDKQEVKKGSTKLEKMDVDSVKGEVKKEKAQAGQSAKPSRPSSTPPSDTVIQDEKCSTSGLKRTLSEGYEKDEQTVQRDVKRPKVDGMELEAQLELKITAKASSRLKLEKVVQQLVEERLRVLQLTVFDKSLQDLKDRVDKIDCATKHQTALNTLQTKIARLSKKFGEANQVSENKRKQEALAAAAAATAAKTAAANTPPTQRVLRRQTVEPQPEAPREGLAPSVGKTPALSVKKKTKEEKEEEEEEEDLLVPRHVAMAERLSEYSEGKCRADIKLRSITSPLERALYHNCKRSSGRPRPDRYASYIFRNLVPYETYCDWVSKVNYVGLLGKDALPTNLRRTLRIYIERRFTELPCESWREIRDSINEILRVKRTPEFFRSCDERTAISSS